MCFTGEARWGADGHARDRCYIDLWDRYLDPAAYLRVSYYEKWAFALEALLVDAGVVTPEEIAERVAALAEDGG